jgi:hypothetical protein
VTPEEIRDLANRLGEFAQWCFERSESTQDEYAWLAGHVPSWAATLHRFAIHLEDEELDQ